MSIISGFIAEHGSQIHLTPKFVLLTTLRQHGGKVLLGMACPSMTCTDMTMSTWNQIGKGERRKRSAHQMVRIDSNTLDQLLNGEGWDVSISWVSVLCKSLAFVWSERVYYYPYFAKRETDAQGIHPISVKSRKTWTWALSQVCPVPRPAPLSPVESDLQVPWAWFQVGMY